MLDKVASQHVATNMDTKTFMGKKNGICALRFSLLIHLKIQNRTAEYDKKFVYIDYNKSKHLTKLMMFLIQQPTKVLYFKTNTNIRIQETSPF